MQAQDQDKQDAVSCNNIKKPVNEKDNIEGTSNITTQNAGTLATTEEVDESETFEKNAMSGSLSGPGDEIQDFGRECSLNAESIAVSVETSENKNESAINENTESACLDCYSGSIEDKTTESLFFNEYYKEVSSSNEPTILTSASAEMEYTEEYDNTNKIDLPIDKAKNTKEESEKIPNQTSPFKDIKPSSPALSSHSNDLQSPVNQYLSPKRNDGDKKTTYVNDSLIWPQSPEENVFMLTSRKETSNDSYKKGDVEESSQGYPVQTDETANDARNEGDQSYYNNDVEMWGAETYANYAQDYKYKLTVESVPVFYASTHKEFQNTKEENFLRGCKWSPDGSCIATNSNDNCLRVFKPFETQELGDTENSELSSKVKMKESGQIYDYAWHPGMNLYTSDFCRVACTCSGIPIHMWDSETGKIIANYRAYDQYDEVTAAYSLSFTLDGSKIYAGYNKAIRIFDTEYPVKSCKLVRTTSSKTKDGQTGIISCFAHSPDGSGLYVAGSYSRHIGIYDSACDKLVCLIQGQQGGVTHVMFSPDGSKLYSGGRKDAEILCWDVRNMGHILFSALRDVKTNQRMYFDLSQSGQYLVSGNNDGTVAFWNTLDQCEEINGDMFLKPCSQFYAHSDCVNGVSINHQHHMIATASGQRHFQDFGETDSEEEADQERHMKAKMSWDFSLKLWRIPIEEEGRV